MPSRIEVVVCKSGLERHDRDLAEKVAAAGAVLTLTDCFDKCETCERVVLARIDGMMARFATGDELVDALRALAEP